MISVVKRHQRRTYAEPDAELKRKGRMTPGPSKLMRDSVLRENNGNRQKTALQTQTSARRSNYSNTFKGINGAPGADLNHRHQDFQYQ